MLWITKSFSELTTTELDEIYKIRLAIFVVEQNCVYQDIDGKDQKAFHLFAKKEGEIIAYTRLFKPGDYYTEASLGRVLVTKSYRGTGLGHQLIDESIKALEKLCGKVAIKIGAQLYLKDFYEKHNFKQISDTYIEDGIPHIHMLRSVDN